MTDFNYVAEAEGSSLSSYLDPAGTVTIHATTQFSIQRSDGLRVSFHGTGFTYDGSNLPTGGTITEVVFEDPLPGSGTLFGVVQVTNLSGGTDLGNFWDTASTDGAKRAFDDLFGTTNVTGNDLANPIESYSSGVTLDGLGGNDTIDIWHNNVTAKGGNGDDFFRIKGASPFGLSIDGQGGFNTIEISGAPSFSTLKNIGQINFAAGSGAKSLTLTADQIAVGLVSPNLKINFSKTAAATETFTILDPSAGIANLDISAWKATRLGTTHNVNLFLDKTIAHTVHLPNFKTSLVTGSGNDTIFGGAADELINPGAGLNTIDGGGGVNSLYLFGGQSDFDFTFHGGAHPYLDIDDNRGGDPGGHHQVKFFTNFGFFDGGLTELTNKQVATIVGDHAPKLAHTIATVQLAPGKAQSYTVPAKTFTDPDGDELTYFAAVEAIRTLPGGKTAGDFIHFDSATRTFDIAKSTPPGVYSIALTASDGLLDALHQFYIFVGDGKVVTGTGSGDKIDATHAPAGQPKPGAAADFINAGKGTDNVAGLGGADWLKLGPGGDTATFFKPSEGGDTALDFSAAQDKLAFKSSAFGGLHAVNSSAFVENTSGAATKAGQRFIFDTDDHALYFDANGKAAGQHFLIINLPGVTHLDASNFDFLP